MTDYAKKGTQLCLIEESYITKESEIQLRFRYDQFISSNYVAVRRLKVHKRFREPSRISRPVTQLERTLDKSRRKRHLLRIYVKKSGPSSSRIHQFTNKYAFYRFKHGKEEDKYKH